MNEAQYNIVKIFLTMKVSAQRIAREFKAPLDEVHLCEQSYNYQQFLEYKKGGGKDFFAEVLGL